MGKLLSRLGHRTGYAGDGYNRPEHEDGLKFGAPRLYLMTKDGPVFVADMTPELVKKLDDGYLPDGTRIRRHSHVPGRAKLGDWWALSQSASVEQAKKAVGLTRTPTLAFRDLFAANDAALREFHKACVVRRTRTTTTAGGRKKKVTEYVKADFYFIAYAGYHNRAGELSLHLTTWIPNGGRAATGKHNAIHWPSMYRAQKRATAASNLEQAYQLAKDGIYCVPDGNSIRALGIRRKATTLRTRRMNAWLRRRGMDLKDKAARAKAAAATRVKKTRVSFHAAVDRLKVQFARAKQSYGQKAKNAGHKFVGQARQAAQNFKARVRRTVAQLSEKRQERLADRALLVSIKYCKANALRFTRDDIFATGAFLAVPHVSAAVYARVFDRKMPQLRKHGVVEVKRYPGGFAVYTSAKQMKLEHDTAEQLASDKARRSGGLSSRTIAKALAARGYTTTTMREVEKLAGRSGTVIDSAGLTRSRVVLTGLVEAYHRSKKDVILVGRSLGREATSAKSLADQVTQTSHLKALWKGLRTPGPLDHKLKVASLHRRYDHTPLRRGTLVVADVGVLEAGELKRIATAVTRARGKLVLVGNGAAQWTAAIKAQRWSGSEQQSKAQQHQQHQQQQTHQPRSAYAGAHR